MSTVLEQDERRDGDQLGWLRTPPEGTRPGTDRTKSSMGCEVDSRDSSSQDLTRPCFRRGAGKDSCDQRIGAPSSLAPLHAFATSGPRDSVRPVPAYVAFFLRFLAGAVERERHCQCAATFLQVERAPRVDAQASDERAGVGGWLPAVGHDGRPEPGHSYWFAEEITPEAFP